MGVYLTGVYLMGVHLMGMHLMDVYLMGVHLMGLKGVYLTGVYLMGVHLTGVYLMGVHLMGVYLMGVHLMGVYLMGAYLMGVHPIGVCFMDVYIFPSPRRLWRTFISPALQTVVNLSRSELQDTSFYAEIKGPYRPPHIATWTWDPFLKPSLPARGNAEEQQQTQQTKAEILCRLLMAALR